MSQSTYSVYLVEHGESGGKRHVTSPVEGHELEFYDSGVWLDRETGRNFFPYEQIRTIREHPEGTDRERGSEPAAETDATEGKGPDEEERDESDEIEGESTETDPEEDPGVEGDSGAEEDMLEE